MLKIFQKYDIIKSVAGVFAAKISDKGDILPSKDISEKIWYINVKGKQSGPFTYEYVNTKVKTGKIAFDDFVYKEGMDDWVQIGTLPQFGSRTPIKPDKNRESPDVKIPKAPTGDDKIWYLSNPDTQVQQGPMSIEEAQVLLETGKFTFEDYAWTEKFGEEWKPISEVKELDRRIRSNMPRMPSSKKLPLNDPSGEKDETEEELSRYSSDEIDLSENLDPQSQDVFKVDVKEEFDDLELTKGGEHEFLVQGAGLEYSNNKNETPQTYESVTKTEAVKKDDYKPKEEDIYSDVKLQRDVKNDFDTKSELSSLTQSDIPDEINDNNAEAEEEEKFESTYSGDAFTESIEGETSCSLVDIETTNTSIDGLTSKKKKPEKLPKRGRSKKPLVFLFVLLAGGYAYMNYDYLNSQFEIEKALKSVLPIQISSMIFSESAQIIPDESSHQNVQHTTGPDENSIMPDGAKEASSHLQHIENLSSAKEKDQYVLETVGNDLLLQQQSSRDAVYASRNYKTKNHEIMLLQLSLPETSYEDLRKRSGLFRKLIKEKRLKLRQIKIDDFAKHMGELHLNHNKPLGAISWFRISARYSKDPNDKGLIYERIGDLYSERNKHPAAIKSYKTAFKHSKNQNLREKIRNSIEASNNK